jgi:predicted NAD/FAD-binding protein
LHRHVQRRNSVASFSSTPKSFSLTASQRHGHDLDVAILGGGISGLCTAFYLLAWHERVFPGRAPKITIYESADRLGGWIRTSKESTPNGDWYFEHGPRTLRTRPSSMLLQLVSPPARSRNR